MTALGSLYCEFLLRGFMVLKTAQAVNDPLWLAAEIELFHNVPSLIEDTNFRRHRYFWLAERPHYLDWVAAQQHGNASKCKKMFYEPLWSEMEPLILGMADSG
jgi:hypothetical protein